MSAVICRDWRPMTLAELFYSYQSFMIDRWDHTSSIMWAAKSMLNAKLDQYHFHPYRDAEAEATRTVIRKDNFGLLLAFLD